MDLDGNGIIADADDAAAYLRAFPGRKTDAPNANGCDSDDNLTPTPSVCIGYELMNDLDFDENGDGLITAAGDPTYWNGGAGWTPIGGVSHASFAAITNYTATFDGNGRGISNLYINRAIDGDAAYNLLGLFTGVDGSAGRIRGVNLLNPQVSITRSGTVSSDRLTYVATLTGYIGPGARVDGSRVVGGAVTIRQGAGRNSVNYVGCLAGRAYGTSSNRAVISASGASCAVNVNVPLRLADGRNIANVGGLVGASFSGLYIIASYATGGRFLPRHGPYVLRGHDWGNERTSRSLTY